VVQLVRVQVAYCNEDRPHMSLDGDAPVTRLVEPPNAGRVVEFRRVGGVHRGHARAA